VDTGDSFNVSAVRVLTQIIAAFRVPICPILSQHLDLLVVGEAWDGLQAHYLQPDLIVLELRMSKLNGLAAAHVARLFPAKIAVVGIRILALSPQLFHEPIHS
jgi:CheY-like chemotaxis protein